MEIRRFKNGDEVPLLSVFLSSIRKLASQDYSLEQINAWASEDIEQGQWAEHIRELRPFVVEIDGEIVGYADVQSNGYIDHFYVSGDYPRQGVGTLLMHTIDQEAKLLGLTKLTANVSITAEHLFMKHGFRVVKRNFPVCRGVTLQNALMCKVLGES